MGRNEKHKMPICSCISLFNFVKEKFGLRECVCVLLTRCTRNLVLVLELDMVIN
jgi:hypothetical protein